MAAARREPARDDLPTKSYLALTAIFNGGLVGVLTAAHRAGRLPKRVSAGDLVLLGVATHKLSRVIAKEKPTSPLRAPFAEYEGRGGPGELEERAQGDGARRAVGELLTCPYCLDQWVAGGFLSGLVFAPRVTRTVASLFAVTALSDFLQLAYRASEQRVSVRRDD
jgi:hypothetical protein